MSKLEINDSFIIPESPDKTWQICESEDKSVVDGIHVLGRCVGPMFVYDAASKNDRWYSKKLWERAINENKDRMINGSMLGTIGHEQPIDDKALLEGKISHKVTKLWIDEKTGTGMGEILVLGTTSGVNLNACMRAGIPVAVSSRAGGEYKGKHSSGANIVNEDTFDLNTFDFVLKPGVTTAIPIMVEHDSAVTEDSILPRKDMMSDNTLLESITADKIKLQNQLNESLSALESEKQKTAALQLAIDSGNKDVTRLEGSLTESASKLELAESNKLSLVEELKSYKDLGSPAEIEKAFDESTNLFEAYKEFGSINELTEAFTKSKTLIKEYSEIGSPDELENIVESFTLYTDLATIDEVNQMINLLEVYSNLGSPSEVETLISVTSKYADLGSPDKISEAFETMESLVTKFDVEHRTKESETISAKYGRKQETVESMLVKHGKAETIRLLEELKTDTVSDRYRAPRTELAGTIVTKPGRSVNESLEGLDTDNTSRASRLLKQASR